MRVCFRRFRGLAAVVSVTLGAVLAAAPARAQSTVLGGINTGASFYSGYRFNTHWASGYYWTTFKDGTCGAGRIRVYNSPDGTTWSPATGSPVFSTFCPNDGAWAVRFQGNVVVAFAYNSANSNRYYSKGTFNGNGSITWQRQEDPTGLPTVATDIKLNAAIVNNKPVLWQADAASAGRVSVGSSLDSPTWTNVANPTALTAGLPNNGSNGQFSAGAVFPLWGKDPNDFIVIRATSAGGLTAQGHRVVTIKFHAATASFDTLWYNVSTLENSSSTAVPPDPTLPLPEDATTNVSLGSDDVVQTRFAAAQMSDGMIHVVYVNQNGNIIHYRRGTGSFDEVAQDAADKPLWTQHFNNASDIDGGATAVDKVGLSVVDSNNFYLFYSRVGSPATLYYRRFDSRAWGAETTIRAGVTLNYSFGTMETARGCRAGVAWNEGTNPYAVLFRLVNPACTPPTTYYRSIGTAADYTQGQVVVTNGSKTVNGTGVPAPAWIGANRGLGDLIVIPCNNPPTCTGGVAYTIASVDTETRLTLTAPYSGTGTFNYVIQRQFQSALGNAAQALIDWENCIDGGISGTACTYANHAFNPPAASSGNLVTANRREIGVLYKDSVIQPAATSSGGLTIRGLETSSAHNVVLTVAARNRPVNGRPATAGCITTCENVVYDGGGLGNNALRITDNNVTVEWIEFRNFRSFTTNQASGEAAVAVVGPDDTTLGATFPTGTEQAQNALFDRLLIHDFADPTAYPRAGSPTNWYWTGIRGHSSCCKSLTVRNTMIWDGDRYGIELDEPGETYRIENVTIDYMHIPGTSPRGIYTADSIGTVKNTIVTSNTNDFYRVAPGEWSDESANNISTNGTPPGANPQTVALANLNNLYVTPASPGPGDLHLEAGSNADVLKAVNTGVDLSLRFLTDVDGQYRPAGAWDIGADERDATTVVELASFAATALDSAVGLDWQTASELNNLGFHLHRSTSAAGPYERITAQLIPGLGSSATGSAYSYLDSGLTNGVTYFYKLEDVDASSVSTFHGPVSAVPAPAVAPPSDGGGDGPPPSEPAPGSPGASETPASACPAWVLAAYGSTGVEAPTCTRYGDPDRVSLELVAHDARGATLELRTGGFWAVGEESGTVRVFIPGFDTPVEASAPALPLRRALVDAVVGKKVELVSVEAFDRLGFPGLRPSATGQAEALVFGDGTVRAGRRLRPAPRLSRGHSPPLEARLSAAVFQGATKSAVVEIWPVRFDGTRQQLELDRLVRVRLAFTGPEAGETGRGFRGRRLPRRQPFPEVLARLFTARRGLYAVRFEELFPGRQIGMPTELLCLQRQGEAVAFHVEPPGLAFRPGSALYFFAESTASSTDYTAEIAYELVRSIRGQRMEVVAASPESTSSSSASRAETSFETNRIYLPHLLEAPDIWLWQMATSGAAPPPPLPFSLTGVDPLSPERARLLVHLQGGSESGSAVDHHVGVSINGVLVGEASFAGMKPHLLDVSLPVTTLREGSNELALANFGDTGVVSRVFLDRFTVSYPQRPSASGGLLLGTWSEGGTAEVGAVSEAPVVLDVTAAKAAKWLRGLEASGSSLRFRAEAGHVYLVASREAWFVPRVARPTPSTLRGAGNQADYLVVAPRAFLGAAQPLLERRESQGLRTRAVSFEEIAEVFGHGRPSAEAIRAFLGFAYHSWSRPSPRYVLLLGDSTYDPQRFLASSLPSPLPALWTKTPYLWTVSDPALAAVNGEDPLPDLAIGRLPATTAEDAQKLVDKLLAWEDSGQGVDSNAVLVADNPDAGGDFEADVEDIRASFLEGRPAQVLKLSELGSSTRAAILDAFDNGASLVSYVGHGGTALWASENVFNSWDVPKLLAQSRQPFLLTLNCLNGYFVAPAYDALPEALLKAEGRGVIAAFSPSGLSLDGPAHQYHRALVAELTGGGHATLGDAILAAQRDYARTGLAPGLLSVYHLLGDPATRIR